MIKQSEYGKPAEARVARLKSCISLGKKHRSTPDENPDDMEVPKSEVWKVLRVWTERWAASAVPVHLDCEQKSRRDGRLELAIAVDVAAGKGKDRTAAAVA